MQPGAARSTSYMVRRRDRRFPVGDHALRDEEHWRPKPPLPEAANVRSWLTLFFGLLPKLNEFSAIQYRAMPTRTSLRAFRGGLDTPVQCSMASSSEADSEGVEEDDETEDLLPPRIAFLRSQRGLRAEKGEGAGEVDEEEAIDAVSAGNSPLRGAVDEESLEQEREGEQNVSCRPFGLGRWLMLSMSTSIKIACLAKACHKQ